MEILKVSLHSVPIQNFTEMTHANLANMRPGRVATM